MVAKEGFTEIFIYSVQIRICSTIFEFYSNTKKVIFAETGTRKETFNGNY